MLDFVARNWVLVSVVGAMAFMRFGMHRGHGHSGHAGGCGGGGRAQDGHEPDAHSIHPSDTANNSQSRLADGGGILRLGSQQDRPAPSGTSVQAQDAAPRERRHRGC